MKLVNLLVIAAVLVFGAGKAFAHPSGGHHHNPPPHHHYDDDGDVALLLATTLALELVTLTHLTEATADSKLAILNASPDALAVLDGAEPTDLFLNGRAVAEALLGMQFETDQEAAMVILEYSETQAKAQ